MGITINHRLKHRRIDVAATLDRVEAQATEFKTRLADPLGIEMTVRRESDVTLLVDIGHCETLALEFKTPEEIESKDGQGWSYEHAVLTNDGKRELDKGYMPETYPQNAVMYAAGFCKTQFSQNLAEHRIVAELIRTTASNALMAEVSDEGDYYHSLDIGDAAEAIDTLGAMITGLGSQLREQFGAENVQAGGETVIKGRSRRTKKA